MSRDFYQSPEWIKLRRWTIKKYGRRCLKCDSTRNIEVDHVKARSKHPKLALSYKNTQPLCRKHNRQKGTNTANYRGLRGFITRGAYRMKNIGVGIIIGILLCYGIEDMSLGGMITYLQHGLNWLYEVVASQEVV